VQAKDKSGNPVTMMITPNSLTEMVDQGSTTSGTSSGAMFAKIPATDRLSSEIVGLVVYNRSKQDIGTIKDIAYAGPNVNAYIVAVGGFLGMGDHCVAVNPSDISVAWDAGAKKWHASMDTTADQLKAAPEFKYPAKS
jgi:PRC-barrel domain